LINSPVSFFRDSSSRGPGIRNDNIIFGKQGEKKGDSRWRISFLFPLVQQTNYVIPSVSEESFTLDNIR